MKKPKKDPVREDRIHNEANVDANGPEEQVMGWYYYLDDKIRFPFQAKCVAHEGGTDGEVGSDNDNMIDDSAHVVAP